MSRGMWVGLGAVVVVVWWAFNWGPFENKTPAPQPTQMVTPGGFNDTYEQQGEMLDEMGQNYQDSQEWN